MQTAPCARADLPKRMFYAKLRAVPTTDPETLWNNLLSFIEHKRVIPIIGEELLTLSARGSANQAAPRAALALVGGGDGGVAAGTGEEDGGSRFREPTTF